MKTISIVSTQMQFINCVEYLKENNFLNNTVIFYSASHRRYNQLQDVYRIQCNNSLFKKVYSFTRNGNIIHDNLVYLLFLILLILLSVKSFDICLLGNYKVCFGRFFLSMVNRCKCVAVDDGLATIIWYKERYEEVIHKKLNLFYNNRLLKWLIHNRGERLIPGSVEFFTIYEGDVQSCDSKTINNYCFIKSHLVYYPNVDSFKRSDVVFLGQPFYSDGYITNHRHNEYLRLLNNHLRNEYGIKDSIYYAHPREIDDGWMENDNREKYRFVENSLSFEIYALALNPHSIVASYQTSSLAILHKLCPDLRLFSVYINEIDGIEGPVIKEFKEVYEYFTSIGIPVLHFS